MRLVPPRAAAVVLPVSMDDVRQLSRITEELCKLVGHTLTAHNRGLEDQAGELRALALAKSEELIELSARVAGHFEPRPRPAFTLRRAA